MRFGSKAVNRILCNTSRKVYQIIAEFFFFVVAVLFCSVGFVCFYKKTYWQKGAKNNYSRIINLECPACYSWSSRNETKRNESRQDNNIMNSKYMFYVFPDSYSSRLMGNI